ncbi:hypothetical protein GCM10007907_27980 [Chitinimonas prasina]|uniref:Novel toxin 15 domain-containing protein n=1 Tax=Chitinimonas prasina TaxID=1434937 RepID=A0ABQ5YHS4_9NEIS|nr:hypothetical protein [Chitinimonas prasina]GLR14008.1 hypothetical protein GCM10007907_27980 [Chitinimonas prasina]
MSRGLVEALLGGLEGGAAYMAKDSDRRVQEQQKVMDREALFSDWQRRYSIEMSTNAAEDDHRSARNAQQQLDAYKAKLEADLTLANDPRALEAERRAAARREKEIRISQGPQYARNQFDKEQQAKREQNLAKVVPLISKRQMLEFAKPSAAMTEQGTAQEVANINAALWALGVDPRTVLAQNGARANRYRSTTEMVPNPDPATGEYVEEADGQRDSAGRPIGIAAMMNKARGEFHKLKQGGMSPAEAKDHIRRAYSELDKYPALW